MGEGARWRWDGDTAEALALETLMDRRLFFFFFKAQITRPAHLYEDMQRGSDVPYMVCVCSGYCVVEEETRLGWPCVGGAIILALPCITGLNTCCAWSGDKERMDNSTITASFCVKVCLLFPHNKVCKKNKTKPEVLYY